MSDSLAKALVESYGKLKGARSGWDNLWEVVTSYVLPRKKDISMSGVAGVERNQKVYDASPSHFNELLASALHSMLTNPSTEWFGLRAKNESVKDLQIVKDYLQRFVAKIHMLINNSNFHSEIHELYLDLGCLGTGTIRVLQDLEDVFRFKSRPIYAYWIKEDEKGIIDTIYTVDKLTMRQIIQRYGEKSLPQEKKAELMRDVEKVYEVMHAILPSSEVKELGYNKRKPIASIHVLMQFQHTLKQDGFNTFPIMTPRWNKLSDETYGRSPSTKSLPDIKMINAMMRDTIRAAQKQTDPPMLVDDDSTYGPPNIYPGGINYKRPGTEGPVPMKLGSNAGIGIEIMKDVRERIKQAFFIDQLQLQDGPQMTATEVNARVDEHLRLLGPILGRLHNELLKPLIARLIDIMINTNNLPEGLPPELSNTDLEVLFTSQIAKAQHIAEGQNLNRMLAQVAPIAQIKPEVLDNFDWDSMALYSSDINGVPAKLLLKEADRDTLRKQRAEAQQKAQQQQDESIEADNISKVGKLV